MSPPPVLDAHVHFWSPRSTPRVASPLVKLFGWNRGVLRRAARALVPADALAFVGPIDHVAADYLPATHLADALGLDVRGVVHVEASWQARRPEDVVDETRWLDALDDGGALRAIVGAVDLAHPALDRHLDGHLAASARFRGVRDKLAWSDRRGVRSWAADGARMRSAAWRRGYARLAERGLRFDAWLYHPQLEDFRALVAAHPETPVVLDHVGSPIGLFGPFGPFGRDDAERRAIEAHWKEALDAVARFPHVHVKLSGLTMPISGLGFHARRAPPSVDEAAERLAPPLRFVLERFGPDRCLFASNFPMDKVSLPLGTLFGAFDAITADLPDPDRRKLFHDNAARFYGIEPRGPAAGQGASATPC